MSTVPEKDWKTLRKLKDELLATACDGVFLKVVDLSKSRTGREHEAYLELWDLIQKENCAVAEMFDDIRRSNAVFKIAALRHHEVLTDDHMSLFSEETQNNVEDLVKFKC